MAKMAAGEQEVWELGFKSDAILVRLANVVQMFKEVLIFFCDYFIAISRLQSYF